MERNMVRRAGALACVMVLGLAAVIIDAGPAVAAHRQAAGTYTATFPDTATGSTLVVTNATGSTTSGTFEFTDFGDFGTWVVQGTTMAFLVSASSAGHQGAVLITKLTTAGLDPGEISVPGSDEQPWSAVRVSSDTARAATSPSEATPASLQSPHPSSWAAVFDGNVDDTLTLLRYQGSTMAGVFFLTNLQDYGVWAKLGKKLVLGVTNGEDAGIVLLGTQAKTTIGTPDAPGTYYEGSTGVHPWYATRTS
jgi:hypothetical protein